MHRHFSWDVVMIREEVRELLKFATLASAGGNHDAVVELVDRAGDLLRYAAEVARSGEAARESPR